jgi:hypothetical protein
LCIPKKFKTAELCFGKLLWLDFEFVKNIHSIASLVNRNQIYLAGLKYSSSMDRIGQFLKLIFAPTEKLVRSQDWDWLCGRALGMMFMPSPSLKDAITFLY